MKITLCLGAIVLATSISARADSLPTFLVTGDGIGWPSGGAGIQTSWSLTGPALDITGLTGFEGGICNSTVQIGGAVETGDVCTISVPFLSGMTGSGTIDGNFYPSLGLMGVVDISSDPLIVPSGVNPSASVPMTFSGKFTVCVGGTPPPFNCEVGNAPLGQEQFYLQFVPNGLFTMNFLSLPEFGNNTYLLNGGSYSPVVPEPSTHVLLGTGLGAVIALLTRRRILSLF